MNAFARAMLLAGGIMSAAGAPAQQDLPPNGIFLVARPELSDPNFRQTVVLVTQAPDYSTFGVILNRPTRLGLRQFLPDDIPAAHYRDAVYFGGPVMPQALVAAFYSDSAPAAPAFHVLKGIYLSMHPDNLKALLADRKRRYRLYAGFSGWAPRQLESEFARADWYVLPADAATVFRRDMEGLWQELVRKAEIRPVRMKGPAEGGAMGPESPGSAAKAARLGGGISPPLGPRGRRLLQCGARVRAVPGRSPGIPPDRIRKNRLRARASNSIYSRASADTRKITRRLTLLKLKCISVSHSERLMLRVLLALLLLGSGLAHAQDDEAMLLVAHPAFRDADYRQTVLIAAPAPNGGHVGVILNRPTRRSLGSLFPEHEPSKKVIDPVYYGGPFSRGALVALVRTDANPGTGSVLLMKNLYLAFRANTIDRVIEATPNDARYYVGYVGWRPGELRSEIERGLWSVLNADLETVFRKDVDGLWEELLQQSRRIRADGGGYAAALAGDFSNVILPPR